MARSGDRMMEPADLSYTWKTDPGSLLGPQMTVGLKGENLLGAATS